jgi:hypothetical protein
MKSILTIAIPTYHEGYEFERCLSSALSQNKSKVEIVITDNNINRKLSVIEKFLLNENVRYKKNDKNIGSISNFIECWHLAKTRYFTWLGDDDFLAPDFANVIINEIIKNKSYIAWSGIPTHFTNINDIKKSGKIFRDISGSSPIKRIRLCALFGKWNYPIYSVIDRHRISIAPLQKISFWPLPLDGIDWAWSFYLAMCGDIKMIKNQLYFYNIGNWIDKNKSNNTVINYGNNYINSELNLCIKTISKCYNINRFINHFLLLIYGIDESLYKKKIKEENNIKQKHKKISEMIKDIFLFLVHRHDVFSKNFFDENNLKLAEFNESIICISKKNLNIKNIILELSKAYDVVLRDNISIYQFVTNAFEFEISNELNEILSNCYVKINTSKILSIKPFDICLIQTKFRALFDRSVLIYL